MRRSFGVLMCAIKTVTKRILIQLDIVFLINHRIFSKEIQVNLFTTESPFSGTKCLGFSKGRGSGALMGLIRNCPR